MDKNKSFQDLFHAYKKAYSDIKSAQIIQNEVNDVWLKIKKLPNLDEAIQAKINELTAIALRKKSSLLNFWSKVSYLNLTLHLQSIH